MNGFQDIIFLKNGKISLFLLFNCRNDKMSYEIFAIDQYIK